MMINSLCGSLKSENSCSSSNDPSIADLKKAPFLTQIDMEAKSPENSLWDHYFTDLFEGDFMISSPVRNFTSPQASNIKKLSPLHRVFNSPNNNNNNNQFIQTESLSQLELEGFLDGNYEREIDDLLAYMPIKNGWNLSSDCNDIYEGREAVAISLSEQLEQEREREKQLQQKLPPPHHQTLPPLHDASGGMVVVPPPTAHEQDNGLQLVHLLLACAEAASKDDYILARRYLSHLNRVVTPLGDSIQRVTSCFTQALAARLAATQNPKTFPSKPFTPFPPNSLETLKNYQILYQSLPFIKFSHYTANQAIFEAFDGEDCVHIIDLDILQGYQWPAFMQALAARPGGPPFLRITGIGPSENDVRETGRCLTELALSLNIPFEFHSVGEQLENLKPHMFNRKVGEALAVNSINILHRVPGNFLGNLLSTIRDQAPNIFVIVEQEASHNGPYFLGRFLEALHYYSAIFDSLDATFTMDSAQRARVEQCVFGPEIRNIVAAEGVERVIRSEKVEKWRKIMEGKGFERVALSSNAVTQSEILLGFYSCDGYRLTQDKGCLLLGWQDRPILAASAWRC